MPVFTMIVQTETDEPALEVLNASGEFIKVVARPGCFVVNLADMFMRMTNDKFLSTVHRVVNKGTQDRYSLPFFFGANANELIEVVPTYVAEGEEPKYGGLTTYEVCRTRNPCTLTASPFLTLTLPALYAPTEDCAVQASQGRRHSGGAAQGVCGEEWGSCALIEKRGVVAISLSNSRCTAIIRNRYKV